MLYSHWSIRTTKCHSYATTGKVGEDGTFWSWFATMFRMLQQFKIQYERIFVGLAVTKDNKR